MSAITTLVVLDAGVPDLRTLLDGLTPGSRAHVLDGRRDGVEQIAAIIEAGGYRDLDTLSLVAHGRPGAVVLGSSVLDANGLARHASALAMIGAALADDGAVRLYACDVAFGAAGRTFVADLARAIGRDVAAASHGVGSADLGGSWSLNAGTGAAMDAPFTPAALEQYAGLLGISYTTPTDPYPALANSQNLLFGDFNGDGYLDYLYKTTGTADGTNIFLALNNRNGTYTTIQKPDDAATYDGTHPFTSGPLTGIDFQSVTQTLTYARDFNGDGRTDLLVAQANQTPQLYLNTGSGLNATAATPFAAQAATGRFVFGDFNGDGYLDVLNQSTTTAGSGITLYVGGAGGFNAINASNGTFSSGPLAGITLTSVTTTSVYAADLNHDGVTDLIDAQLNTAPKVYLSSGTSLSAAPNTGLFPTQTITGAFVFGDFDSDGDVDVLNQVGNTSGQGITYYQNNGAGTFTAIAKPNDATAGDGTGTFTAGPFAGQDFTSIRSNNLRVVDADHDGDVDIVDTNVTTPRYYVQGSNSGGDGSPPTLTASNPADNATGVSRTAALTLTFDEAVFAGSGNLRIVRVSDHAVAETISVASGQVTISGDTVTVTHAALAQGTTYAVQVDQGAFTDTDEAVYAGIPSTDYTTLNFTTVADQPPVVTPSGGTTAATEQVAVAVDAALALSDPDNASLASATVAITAGFRAGEDTLAFTNTGAATYGNIAASYNASTGVLTLTSAGATATVAQFEAALRAVTYTDTSDAPDTGARTVSFTVSDGVAASAASTKALSVAAVNDGPAATAPASIAVTEDAASPLTGISFSDPDAGASAVRATLSVTAGTLATAGGAGVTVTGAGTGTLVLDGTVAALNTFIAGAHVTYTTAPNANGTVPLSVVIDDLGNTGSGGVLTDSRTVTLSVTPVADTPSVTNAATSEDAQTTSGLVVTRNPADGSEVAYVKVTNVQHGTVYLADGATAVAAGSFITYAQANAGLKFTPDANYNGTGSFDVQASTTASNAGLGGGVVTATISVAAVNDAPTATNLTQPLSLNEDAAATHLFTAAPTIADVDSALVTATLTLADPAAGVLTNAGAGTNGVYTITGSPGPVAAALAAINFAPSANYNGATTVAVAIDDGQNGPQGTNPNGTISITVGAVNDAPTATNLTQSLTLNEDAAATALFAAAPTIAEVDSPTVTATLTLASTAAGTLTGAGVGTNGVYTITGAPGAVAAALAGITFTPAADYHGSTSAAVAIDDGQNGPQGTNPAGTVSITVASVNDAPSGTDATRTILEDAPYTFAVADFGLTDARDSPANALAGVVFSGPVQGGTLTLNGVAVTAGQEVDAADIAAGHLVFTPAANASGAGLGQVSFQVRDDGGTAGGGVDLDPAAHTVTFNVAAVNDAPTASGLSVSITVPEDVAATTLLPTSPTVGDIDSATITATLTVADPAVVTLTGAGIGTNGVYTITGSPGAVSAALAAVTFTPAADYHGSTSVGVAIDDGQNGPQGSNPTGLVSLTVSAINDAPTATNLTQSLTLAEDAAATHLFGVAPTINDVDSPTVTATLTLADPGAGALTNAGVGTNGVYTITGSPGAVATALANVSFAPAASYNGATTVAVAVDDGQSGPQGSNPSGTISITVTAVNDAPTATNLTQPLTLAEDAAATHLFTAAPTVADVDSATVTATLTLADPAVGSLAGAGVGTDGVYTLTGSPGAVSAALAAVTFTPTADYNGTTSVAVAVTDGQNGPQGTNPTGTVSITVTPVNDAPVGHADAYQTDRNTPLVMPAAAGVLANDTDVDGDALNAALATQPAHGTLTLNPDGSFLYTPTPGFVGTDAFTYRASDGTALSASTAVTLTVGTPVPTGLALAAADDTGASNADRLTSKSAVTVTGSGQAGASVAIFDDADNNGVRDGGESVVGTAIVTAGGTFAASVTLNGDGVHHLVATQTTLVGTSLGSTPLDVTLDTTAPSLTLSLSAGTGVGVNHPLLTDAAPGAAPGTLVLNAAEFAQAFRLGGSASDAGGFSTDPASPAGARVTFSAADGHGVDPHAVALRGDGAGGLAYAFRVDAPGTSGGANHPLATQLTDGTYTVQAATLDAAGNAGASAPVRLVIDTTADAGTPASLVVNATADGVLNAAEAKSVGFTVAGLDADASAVATFSDGVHTASASVASDGAATVDLTGFNGAVTSSLAITDVHQNTAAVAGNTVRADTIAPAAPSVALAHDTGASATDGLTSDPTLVATPSAAGDALLYGLDGSAYASTAPQLARDGSADAAHTVSVVEQDAAGNVSAAASLTFTLDTRAPAAPGLALAHDTGASVTDRLTNDASLAVAPAEAGGTLAYTVDGVAVAAYDPSALADGAHTVTLTQTDAAGNVSAATSLTFTLDTLAPAAPGLGLAHDTGVSATDHLTSDAGLVVAPAEGGGTLAYSVDGGAFAGSYDPRALADGAHAVAVTQTDAAGNTSAATSLGFVLDTHAPTLSLAGVSGATNLVDGHVLSGTIDAADAGLSVTIRDGGTVLGTTTSDAQGHFSLALPDDTKDGPSYAYALTASATDAAGNAGTSDTLAFALDYTPNRALFGTVAHDTGSHVGQIYALYEGLVGRALDALGAEAWTNALDHGQSLAQVTAGMLASPETLTHLNAASDADYVEQLYATVLGRASDAPGKAAWVDGLAHGLSRAEVADGFVFGAEHLGQLSGAYGAGVYLPDPADAAVARLYYGLLDRAPDAGGLASWSGAAHAGVPLTTIAQGFLGGSEYAAVHGSQTDAGFVAGLYEGALGREPEPAGGQGWVEGLSHGLTRAQVAVAISEGPEARAHLAGQIEQGWHLA